MDEIRVMEQWQGSELNKAKVLLADEATRLLHGEDCLAKIHATVAALFAGAGSDLESLPRIQLEVAAGDAAALSVPVVDLLVRADMAASKSEAKRLIKGGGARINDEKVSDENATVSAGDFDAEGKLKISSGKKKHALVVLAKN
jgi:tyrosyl-tRNA synthetase